MTPSSPTYLPFGALVRAAWEGFRSQFWTLVIVVLVFNVMMVVIHVGVFGTVAWQAFLEYLTIGGAASLGVVPLVGAQYGASLWIVIPVAILTLILQLWFLSSLVVLVAHRTSSIPLSFRALVRGGWRALPQTFVIAVALFLFVRVWYFIMVLVTNLIYRFVGMTDAAVATTNRLFLLVFAAALIVAALIAGMALFSAGEESVSRNPLRRLYAAFLRFWRRPWDIGWRAVVAILCVYLLDQLVVQVAFPGVPVNPQAVLSLFYLPFLLYFIHALVAVPPLRQ